MTDKEMMKLLARFKDAPELGGGFSDAASERVWDRISSDLGFRQTVQQPAYTWRDYAAYVVARFSRSFLRPLSVGVSAFVLTFSGWVLTVNAAFNSVPGDFLYPVKLATERVQLTLASTEQRARLHTEFASRRLDEVLEIASSSREGKDVRVREAINGFKSEIASASEELGNITSVEVATDVAIAVDRKVDEYEVVLAQSEITFEQSSVSVDEVITVVEATNQQVADVIISSHEATQEAETAEYLQTSFQDDLADIRDRQTLLNERLIKIEAVLAGAALPNEAAHVSTIEQIRLEIEPFAEHTTEAMNLFAAGGFRRVLEIVNEMKSTLVLVEEQTATMEIEISVAVSSLGAVELSSDAEVAPEDVSPTTPPSF
jgi:hypothetical protein